MQEACEQCGNEMVALCPVCLDAEKPAPAMPECVRELVDRIREWPTAYASDRELHKLAAAVEAHYAKEVR